MRCPGCERTRDEAIAASSTEDVVFVHIGEDHLRMWPGAFTLGEVWCIDCFTKYVEGLLELARTRKLLDAVMRDAPPGTRPERATVDLHDEQGNVDPQKFLDHEAAKKPPTED